STYPMATSWTTVRMPDQMISLPNPSCCLKSTPTAVNSSSTAQIIVAFPTCKSLAIYYFLNFPIYYFKQTVCMPDFLFFVCDPENRPILFLVQLTNKRKDNPAVCRIKRTCHFIKNQHFRHVHQIPDKCHPLFFPAR